MNEIVILFCLQAHMHNYTFPRYVWMAYDWFPPQWWTYERSHVPVNCTDAELSNFIEGSLSFQWQPVSDVPDVTTDTGKVRLTQFCIKMMDHNIMCNKCCNVIGSIKN